MAKLLRVISNLFKRRALSSATATATLGVEDTASGGSIATGAYGEGSQTPGAAKIVVHSHTQSVSTMLPPVTEKVQQLSAPALNDEDSLSGTLRLFALVIAIDRYKSTEIPNLSGCVYDGKDLINFLTDSLRVPSSRIVFLENENATRSEILTAFETRLIGNGDIRKGDAIIVFYAGHGSRDQAPPEWLADGNLVESICPHDEGTQTEDGGMVFGIPDRTFDGLMRKLAYEKGDNITAIFDSCHSGGMSRGGFVGAIRCLPPKVAPAPLPLNLDRDIWGWGLSGRTATLMVPTGFLYKAMQSHVLLAACRPDEQALEDPKLPEPRGAFTVALLNIIREHPLAQLTYARLIELVQLRHQHPQCEGTNKDRVLFNANVILDRSRSFKVTKQGQGYIVEAGSINGVVEGTEFGVEAIHDADMELFDSVTLVATRVEAVRCVVAPKSPSNLPDGLQNSRAIVRVWNTPQMKASFRCPDGGLCSVVAPNECSDVVVHLGTGDAWDLERFDPLTVKYSRHLLSIRNAHISNVLNAASVFNFHLYRRNAETPIKHKLLVQLHRLQATADSGLRPVLVPTGDDLLDVPVELVPCRQNVSYDVGELKEAVITQLDQYYGLTLLNHSQYDLFPHVFYFDPNDYSIQTWYLPPSPTMSAPLPRRGDEPSKLSIGYGGFGTDSLRFSLLPDAKVDSGFLKIFVSTAYVDMRSIQQESPLGKSSRHITNLLHNPLTTIWDECIHVLTCKASA